MGIWITMTLSSENKRQKETYESNYGGVSFFVVFLQVQNERKVSLLAFAILKEEVRRKVPS